MEKIDSASRLSLLLKKVIPEPITKLVLSAGSNPGDNVVGKMLSIDLETLSGRKETLIIKGLLPYGNQDPIFTQNDKLLARVMTIFKVFSTELGLYQRILPELEKYFPFQLSLPTPKFFYGTDDVENHGVDACLVLEDLRPKGYRMADKINGLTFEEVTLVLREIARFHAVSFVYLQTAKKAMVELLRNDVDSLAKNDPLAIHIFSKSAGMAEHEHTDFMRQIYFGLINHAKEINAISTELHDKIIKFQTNPLQKVVEDSKQAGKDYFHTVIHGDLWANNILIKYDDIEPSKPVAVSFIDFQQCRYSSVFDELHYFFYTSISAEFRKKNLKQLLDFYYDTFISTVNELGGPRPEGFARDEFHNGYRKYLGSAFCYAVIAIPFQVGIPPPPSSSDETNQETKEDTESERKMDEQSTDGQYENEQSQEDLKKFVGQMMQGLGIGLQAAAKNSPVAISRFTELCVEMDALGVFDVGN